MKGNLLLLIDKDFWFGPLLGRTVAFDVALPARERDRSYVLDQRMG